MDRALRRALTDSCKDNLELAAKIQSEELACEAKGLTLTSRWVLAAIYASLATDSSALETISVTHIVAMDYSKYGDEKCEIFWTEWIRLSTRMTIPLDDGHLEPLLRDQLEKSNGFQMSLHTYKERPKEERTYENLCETWKK